MFAVCVQMGGMTEFGFPSGCIVAPVTAWRRSLVSSHAAPVWSLGAEPTGILEAKGDISTWLLSAAESTGC